MRVLPACLLALMVISGSQAQDASAPARSAADTALEQLTLVLPSEIASKDAVHKALDELGREKCDQQAIAELGTALDKAGHRREAANAHIRFAEICGGHIPSLRKAVNILLGLSDYSGAAGVAAKLIELEPFNDNGYFLRAVAYDKGGLSQRAIDDYITAIELYGDKNRIASVSYLGMARAYEKLGQFCDAIAPIEAWVAINPTTHDNSQTWAIIASYISKGSCDASMQKHEETFPLAQHNNVVTLPVTVNGIRGQFILDTGATFVSLKSGFAQKAKVEPGSDSFVRLHTASGITDGKRARAGLIALRSLQAKDVPVIVLAGDKSLLGEGVDGLLGMSFLSRFNVTIETTLVRVSARTSR